MKLALIGGGGLRAPLFVDCALRRATALGLREICLMDTDGDQLRLIAPLCDALADRAGTDRAGKRVAVSATTEPQVALRGADFVVTTIRPGGIDGRITDERIAIDAGVLGQETTGAGGFAMALRSIPVILEYARLMEAICPDAWLMNFTNPAGLVTQALQDAGFDRAVGICDSANGAQTAVARWLGVGTQQVEADLFGLNHLSFSRHVTHNGRDVLADLLMDDDFLATTTLSVFEPELVRCMGLWVNEYLYYYWYCDKAVAAQQTNGGRGEEIAALNADFLPALRNVDPANDAQAALRLYWGYEHRRSDSYMRSARQPSAPAPTGPADGEGYAGVALDVIGALVGGTPARTGLNVRNGDAITGLRPGDVVEVSCRVDAGGITAVPSGKMPETQGELIRSVKHYERLTVTAVADRSRELAVEALMSHPLVLSFSRARRLVDDYLDAHGPFTKGWT